ncbi:PREDICTED: C-type lectin domain family 7 member A [Chrysochloris asiatica]|uniref:C-type lectin domain family 7 member A n=1 Tax=Chrysochloris asiatica TaxID=185453 RepID=A0A9B0X236_CHRAS|nr:PREDICTED: C-type lectin domain family 7 member A [Chrysochloris asiatica]
MEYHSDVGNLDEDGYTQLDFSSRGIARRHPISEKGTCTRFPRWCLIAVTLGILCLIMLVITVVLGTVALWRSNSGSNPLENINFPSRSKQNHSQPTKPSLEEKVDPTMALGTTGVSPYSPCLPNWILYEKNCYLLRASLDSWDSSREQCSQLDSSLLKIDNSKELEFIKRQVASQPNNSFWIGLSYYQTKRQWFWEDGSTVSPNLFQIRNTVNLENLPKVCAWIHLSEIYDQHCSVPSYSICERNVAK